MGFNSGLKGLKTQKERAVGPLIIHNGARCNCSTSRPMQLLNFTPYAPTELEACWVPEPMFTFE